MTNPTRLIDDLNVLHTAYVQSINTAVEADDLDLAVQLAVDYDREAISMMADREGRHDLLSHFGLDRDGSPLTVAHDTPLRRLVKHLNGLRAA